MKLAVQRYDPGVDAIRIGDDGAPPLGTSDQDILIYLESAQRMLVTDNRKTMPVHVQNHLAAGHHHWGVLAIRSGRTIGQVVDELLLIWEGSEIDDWVDLDRWIPL